MNVPLHLLSLCAAVVPVVAVVSTAASASVGDFENHGDIGSPAVTGSVAYHNDTQAYLFRAGGDDIWAARDQFHFAWKKVTGDFILRAHAEFLAPGIHPKRKMGIMVRAGLGADDAYVDGARHGIGSTDLQWRRSKGATTEETFLPVDQADVLQLERRGSSFILSAARYGEPFVSKELKDFSLGSDAYVGLFLCAHSTTVAETAIFRDVRFVRPARPDFKPYHDYIGSRLEVLDVFSGRLLSLYQSDEPFEAPNWTLDGASLIYNVSGGGPNKGVLRRFDLATGQPQPFDTGFATHNNNDHVLSFDGSMLGISNQGPESNHQSAVYVLPATGGTPRRITPLTPSYLHGFSPDGKYVVYAGGRKLPGFTEDQYDIYRSPVAGGPEDRLTKGGGRYDGSEYSPDGKYIYYTSTISGRMQIWRMAPDGTNHEQVTHDDLNDWFPHPSPDGKWIAFVSYGPDVPAEDHPYYKHIYLRVMPAAGGPARIVAYVYGGQGTMNVPSWSPDSRRIAFVSNTGR
ncbi:MAG TPA: biopolymer transporter TolR [Opitutaceae bacterium]|jgi:hypothetical protein